jgi:hypothetical protein
MTKSGFRLGERMSQKKRCGQGRIRDETRESSAISQARRSGGKQGRKLSPAKTRSTEFRLSPPRHQTAAWRRPSEAIRERGTCVAK